MKQEEERAPTMAEQQQNGETVGKLANSLKCRMAMEDGNS